MAIYSAYVPPTKTGQSEVDDFRLVSDSKAPLALIFPPFWLAWHKLWLELLVYAVFAFSVALLAIWKPSPAIFYLSGLPGLFILLEGRAMIVRKLERKGWRFAGVVDGDTLENAETRFLAQNVELFQPHKTDKLVIRSNNNPVAHAPAAIGLFPE